MTAQSLCLALSGGRPAVRSFQFTDFHLRVSAGRPLVHKRRRASQVIGDDAEADPSSRAISASIATAPQPMASFDHADATFAANAPPLSATKPALALMRAPRVSFAARSRQDDPPHTPRDRRCFVGSRRESPIARRDVTPRICRTARSLGKPAGSQCRFPLGTSLHVAARGPAERARLRAQPPLGTCPFLSRVTCAHQQGLVEPPSAQSADRRRACEPGSSRA